MLLISTDKHSRFIICRPSLVGQMFMSAVDNSFISYYFLFYADDTVEIEADSSVICMEDQLRSLGILGGGDDPTSKLVLNSTEFKGVDIDANLPEKKVSFCA